MLKILFGVVILLGFGTGLPVAAQCNFDGNFLNTQYDCSTHKSTVTLRICSNSLPDGEFQIVGTVNGFPITYYGTVGGRLGPCKYTVRWTDVLEGDYTLKIGTTLCTSYTVSVVDPETSGSINITPSQSPFLCEGDAITLTATGGSNYIWSFNGETRSGSSITVSPSTNTTYSVSGTVSTYCGSTTAGDEILVTVTPLVGQVSVPSGTLVRCQGGGLDNYAASATYTDPDIQYPYTWTITSNESIAPGTVTNSGVVTWNELFSGIATVSVTAHGCNNSTSTNSRDVTVDLLPTAFHISPPNSVCNGETTTLTLTGSQENVDYELYKDNMEYGSSIPGDGFPLQWSGLTQGTYKIVTVPTSCPSVEMLEQRTIGTALPGQLSITPSEPPYICAGEAIILTPGGGSGYTWSSSPSATWTEDPSSHVITTSPSGTTDYTVSGYENICNTPASKLIKITVYELPVITADDETICSGKSTSIDIGCSNLENVTYAWTIAYSNVSGPPSPGSGTPISHILTTAPNSAGTATYTITPTSSEGCEGNYSIDAVVEVQGNPVNPVLPIGPFCDFETVVLSADPSGNIVDYNWYDNQDGFLHQGLNHPLTVKPAGTYTYKFEAINIFGCISESRSSVGVNVTSACDQKLNWIETIGYTYDPDNIVDPNAIVSHSRSYFDLTGRLAQAQVKNLGANEVWIAQSIKDEFGRDAISTLSAPANQSVFQYKHWFVTDASGNLYDHTKFDQPVGASQRGTLGWYYSTGNDAERNVPETGYPFSRTDYYKDGTGEVRKGARPGETHRMGQGHEVVSGTFPVFGELTDYSNKRNTVFGLTSSPISFTDEAVQSVFRDENGRYVISIKDKSGKTVMTARQGTALDKIHTVSSTVTSRTDPASTNHRLITYFYILHDQDVAISGAGYTVENILTDAVVSNPAGVLPAGFYRVILDQTAITNSVTLTYSNYLLDVSYQFYDDAGRLRCSISPNGYQALAESKPYDKIDKTTYEYNHQGWLLSMTDPDAGTTQYLYRKDGKIRFSQNALQAQNQIDGNTKGKFSFTLYDELGRPVESGEYTGSAYTLSSLSSQLEYPQQIEFSASDKTDWVKTHYDELDPDMPALPEGFEPEFLRGAVSWSENINIKTWYSYDEFGRVTWMAQEPAALNRVFVTKYKYDFLGKVLEVLNASCISGNLQFPFYHHYQYDADQRLSQVYTSTDGSTKKLRATYEYYLHGPLKTIELGDDIQGIDFVYNIHGWLTQINHPDKALDPGGDSNDVFGMVLDYYESALANLFQTSMAPGPADPMQYHKLLDPYMVLKNQYLAYGSQLALRLGESDWRNSIKSVLDGNRSEK